MQASVLLVELFMHLGKNSKPKTHFSVWILKNASQENNMRNGPQTEQYSTCFTISLSYYVKLIPPPPPAATFPDISMSQYSVSKGIVGAQR